MRSRGSSTAMALFLLCLLLPSPAETEDKTLTEGEVKLFNSAVQEFNQAEYLRRFVVLPNISKKFDPGREAAWWATCRDLKQFSGDWLVNVLTVCSSLRLGGGRGPIPSGKLRAAILKQLSEMPCRKTDGSIRVAGNGEEDTPAPEPPSEPDPEPTQAGDCDSACQEARAEEAEALSREATANRQRTLGTEEAEEHRAAADNYAVAAAEARQAAQAIEDGRDPRAFEIAYFENMARGRAATARARAKSPNRSGGHQGSLEPVSGEENLPSCPAIDVLMYCVENFGSDFAACRASLEGPLNAYTGGRCRVAPGPNDQNMIVCLEEDTGSGASGSEKIGPWGNVQDLCDVNPVAKLEPGQPCVRNGATVGSLILSTDLGKQIFELCAKGLPSSPYCVGPIGWFESLDKPQR